MKKEFLEGGKVHGAHGVRGVMRVESWCDSPKILARMKRVYIPDKAGEYKEYNVLTCSLNGEGVLMSLEGIATREDAIAMKNTVLYLKREDIPLKQGAMFLQDMIGLKVIDFNTGRVYGVISSVDDGVASRLYTVSTDKGDVLYPDAPGFIKEVNPDVGMLITPIPGFFEDEV